MLKPVGLINGHYECRSLDETLPIFTDLLAAEVVERRGAVAVVRHPNTDWPLIVHEGGPDAPRKPHGNHYGFRVADHTEVEAAFEYIHPRKREYGIRSVSKPAAGHFAYSIYLNEPGGNTLEIEYYNPRAAGHGRPIAASHWESPLGPERFPGRGYVPQAMSHGTLACREKEASNRFYTETLGLDIMGGGRVSTYIGYRDTPWYVVVLPVERRKLLAPVNRFTLRLGSVGEVESAHASFAAGEAYGVKDIGELRTEGDGVSFIFSDLDRNWWELTSGDGLMTRD